MRCCQVVWVLAVVFGVLDCSSALFGFGGGDKAEKKSDELNKVAPVPDTTTEFFEGRIAHHTNIPYIRSTQETDNNVPALPDVAELKRESKPDQKHEDDKLNTTVFEARSDITSPGFSPDYSNTDDEFDGPSTPLYPAYPPVYARPNYRPSYIPVVPEVSNFLCTFEHHACGFRNQVNIPGQFRHVSGQLADRGGHYMAVDARNVRISTSRLITPYLPGYPGAWACVGFHYLILGPGAKRIELYSQTNETRALVVLNKPATNNWDDFRLHISAHQDVRFFIEAHTDSRYQGVIAIDNFSYYFGSCDRRQWS